MSMHTHMMMNSSPQVAPPGMMQHTQEALSNGHMEQHLSNHAAAEQSLSSMHVSAAHSVDHSSTDSSHISINNHSSDQSLPRSINSSPVEQMMLANGHHPINGHHDHNSTPVPSPPMAHVSDTFKLQQPTPSTAQDFKKEVM